MPSGLSPQGADEGRPPPGGPEVGQGAAQGAQGQQPQGGSWREAATRHVLVSGRRRPVDRTLNRTGTATCVPGTSATLHARALHSLQSGSAQLSMDPAEQAGAAEGAGRAPQLLLLAGGKVHWTDSSRWGPGLITPPVPHPGCSHERERGQGPRGPSHKSSQWSWSLPCRGTPSKAGPLEGAV